jgi:hypothetical protein
MTTVGNNAFVFDPTQISGCRLWLDATDPTSITYSSGTSVSQWRDKSGFRNHVSQATASNQPTISSNYVNGRSAMLFTPNQWVQGSISLDSYTRFLVYSNSVVNVGAAVMDGAGFLQNGGGTTYQDMVGYFNPQPSFQTGSFFRIAEAWFPSTGGTSGRIWIDGTEFTSLPFYAPTGTYSFTYVTLGRRGDGIYFTGAVAEAILFNRQLTTSEMNMMEGYLAFKYGLQSRIPSNHPYRTAIVRTLLPNQAFTTITPSFADWRPTQISGCQLWLDAADSRSITITSGKVTQWRDKSGNEYHVSGTNNGTIDTYNSLNVVQMNNSSSYENSSFSLTGPLSIIVFSKLRSYSDGGFGNWQTIIDNRTGLRQYIGIEGSSPYLRTAYRYGGNSTLNPEIWSLTFSASDNTTFNVNGTSTRGTSTGYGGIGFVNGGIRIGFAGNNSAYWGGWIAEIIIYNSELSSTQVQQIEGYLAWKWGLQPSIPRTHPYKTQVPIKSGIAINSLTTMTQGLWTPRRVSGLQLWLDGADVNGNGTRFATGASVSTWVDKSGNGYNATQGTSANQPTYTGSAVQCKSANQMWMSLSQTFGNLFLSNNSFHVFIVAFGGGSGFITGQVSNGGQNLFLGYGFMDTYQSPWWLQGSPPVSDSVNAINAFEYTGSVGRLYQNGSTYASKTGTLPLTSFSGPQIGRRYSGGSVAYHDHTFCEIVAYTGVVLTTTQRQNIEGYLAWKWGLQSSLPSTHPFVKWPPPP